MNLKKLEEIAKEKGKILLIENRILHVSKENVEIFSDSKLIESNGEQIKCRGIVRNIPVTTFTINDNDRLYNRRLWEIVEGKKIFEGSDCLTNHPEDEGDVNNTCGVWANFKINEETGNADLCCVGDKGALMLEILQVKGKIGFSTVGYGEFLEDGKTVNPETYEYERTDWVRDPSQRTFATHANLVTEEKVEKIEKNEAPLEEAITNNKAINNKDENIDEVKNMDKFIELNFKNNIKATIREAKKNPNTIEGIAILKEIEVDGDVKLEEEVNSAMFELQEKIDSDKKEVEANLVSKTEMLEELQVKYDASTEAIETLKENYNKAKVIIEKMGLAEDAEDVENILKEKETMTKNVSLMTENAKKMKGDIKQLAEDRKVMRTDIKQLVEDRKVMISDIKRLMKERKVMKEDMKKFIEKYKILNKKYKVLFKKQEEVDEETSDEVEPYVFESDVSDGEVEVPDVVENDAEISDEEVLDNEPSLEQDVGDEDLLDEEDDVEDFEEPTEPVEVDEIIEEEDEFDFVDDVVNADEEVIEEEDEMEYEDDGMDEEEVIEDEEVIEEEDEFDFVDDEEEIIEEEDEEEFDFVDDVVNADEEEEVAPVVESKKKVKKVNVVKEEIKKLYIQEAKKFPAIKNIKKMIFNSNSVVDALNKITKFKEAKKIKNKPVKITEKSVRRPDWLLNRK